MGLNFCKQPSIFGSRWMWVGVLASRYQSCVNCTCKSY